MDKIAIGIGGFVLGIGTTIGTKKLLAWRKARKAATPTTTVVDAATA